MKEKYRLETIGYTMKTVNPMIHGDMKSRTVVQRVRRRGGRRVRTPAATPASSVEAIEPS